jgi:hypothetical protein
MYTNVCPSEETCCSPCIVTKHWEFTGRQTVLIKVKDSIISKYTSPFRTQCTSVISTWNSAGRVSKLPSLIVPPPHIFTYLEERSRILVEEAESLIILYVSVLGIWKCARGRVVGWGICYKPEGHGFVSQWHHWIFHFTYPSSRNTAPGWTQPLTEMSTRNFPEG